MAARATLTRDEKRALLNHHISKIRKAVAAQAEAKVPYDEAGNDLTATIDDARGDLGKKRYTRGYLLGLVRDQTAKLRDQSAEEQQRYEDRQDLSLPVVGDQLALALDAPGSTDTERDAIYWEAHGYSQGRRGADRSDTDDCPPMFETARLRGWTKGQDETQKLFVQAQEAIKRGAEPDPAAEAVNMEPPKEEPEAGTPEAKAAERKAVRRAKESLGVPETAGVH